MTNYEALGECLDMVSGAKHTISQGNSGLIPQRGFEKSFERYTEIQMRIRAMMQMCRYGDGIKKEEQIENVQTMVHLPGGRPLAGWQREEMDRRAMLPGRIGSDQTGYAPVSANARVFAHKDAADINQIGKHPHLSTRSEKKHYEGYPSGELEIPGPGLKQNLKSYELIGMKWLFFCRNILIECLDDLRKRISKQQWDTIEEASAMCDKVFNEIIETTPDTQVRNIRNVLNDMEVLLTPKGKTLPGRVVVETEDLRFMLNEASENKCTSCFDDNVECEQCRIYQLLISWSPLQDYKDTHFCPYSRINWNKVKS